LHLTQAVEDDITDHIVTRIEEYTMVKGSPSWVDRFSVQQQRPYSPKGEIGNRRNLLDIFFRRSREENCNQFCFEAKRLYQDQKSGQYFGQDGMQRFLSGEYPVNSNKDLSRNKLYKQTIIGYDFFHGGLSWKRSLPGSTAPCRDC